jgi:hypothetical protein
MTNMPFCAMIDGSKNHVFGHFGSITAHEIKFWTTLIDP